MSDDLNSFTLGVFLGTVLALWVHRKYGPAPVVEPTSEGTDGV